MWCYLVSIYNVIVLFYVEFRWNWGCYLTNSYFYKDILQVQSNPYFCYVINWRTQLVVPYKWTHLFAWKLYPKFAITLIEFLWLQHYFLSRHNVVVFLDMGLCWNYAFVQNKLKFKALCCYIRNIMTQLIILYNCVETNVFFVYEFYL